MNINFKLSTIILSILVINAIFVSGGNVDLADFPDFFIKEGIYEITTVVGDDSSTHNVLAQTYVVVSLSSLGQDLVNIENLLSSEVDDFSRNIISFGNPCVNDISSDFMDNPEPCDKDFEYGKGYIKLFEYEDFFHIVVAGKDDEGTKKAAEILANYQEYVLQGSEYVIEFTPDNRPELIDNAAEDSEQSNIDENEESDEETGNQDQDDKSDEEPDDTKEESIIVIKDSIEGPELIMSEEDNLIKSLINWIKSLFTFWKK